MTDDPGYYETKIPASSDYTEGPAELTVTASPTDFADGLNLGFTQLPHLEWSGKYESVTLTTEQARQLRDAIDAALTYLDAAPAAAALE